MEHKVKKIAVMALILALIGISQTGAITTALNYTFHAGSNIVIIDDGLGNVTISSTVSSGSNGTNGSNGSNGINGTNGINQSDNTKVNKSGDTMTGSLKIYTPQNADGLTVNGAGLGIGGAEYAISTYNKNNTLMNFNAFRAVSKTTFPYIFITRIFADYDGINITNRTYLPDLTTLGLFSFQANNGTNTVLTGTKGRLQALTDGAWTSTRQNTQIRIWNANNKGITIRGDDTVHFQNNTIFDTAGKGIETISPNGNHWCTTTNNLGENVVTAGSCL
jgi:hypothetical protein